MPTSVHLNLGSMMVNPTDVLFLSQETGAPILIQLKGGKLLHVGRPLQQVANELGCHLFGNDGVRDIAFSSDQVIKKTQVGNDLRIDLPDDVFINLPNVTSDIFEYGVAVAKAQRTGQPIPPAPTGVIVQPG